MAPTKPLSGFSGVFAIMLLVALIVAAASLSTVAAQEPSAPVQNEQVGAAHAAMATSIQQNGAIPVIVDLHVPGVVAAAGSDAEAAAVAHVQATLLSSLANEAVSHVKTYSHVPALALTLESAEALQALIANPLVAGIHPDTLSFPELNVTVPLISASLTKVLGYDGLGTAIAILDSGSDRNHSMLFGNVISEACYSSTNAALNSTSLCPGGVPQSTAQNSGLHCNVTGATCFHGTHVASIAAAVAPRAKLIAMQVFSRFTDTDTIKTCANSGKTSPCIATFTSDQLQALNRLYILKTQTNPINLVAINMSLGGGKFTGPCVSSVPNAYSTIITSLRNLHVATVTTAGNEGFTDAMGSPGCLSNVISVGATTDSNTLASYSNISVHTTLLAPGSAVTAALPGGLTGDADGTSMAAPHVAGAIAALRSALPSATVSQIQDALVSTGLVVPDNRSGGAVDNKRRINLYAALCSLTPCDADDFRTLVAGTERTGSITGTADRDPYSYYAVAGNKVNIAFDRLSGSLDPYLELYDPNGELVATNNNGGGGVNALISGHTMQYTGLYTVIARGNNAAAGAYRIIASVQAPQFTLLPSITWLSPSISWLSPSQATANSSAGSFWVGITGNNFKSTTQAYWNGATRITYYMSPTLVYIWVLGSDVGPSPETPRTATITVSNPQPGGGTSNAATFTINSPTLGESELVQPALESTLDTGIKHTFVLSWTVPVTEATWRIMQNMDLRLRDETGRVAASIRVVERPGAGSVYQLLNGAGAPLLDENGIAVEGIPGMAQDLVINDTLTLHMAETSFLGSGLTAIMTPTVTFGPDAVGRWRVEFRVDKTIDEMGSFVQDEDVLGTVTIADPACSLPVESLMIQGPDVAQTGVDAFYTLDILPLGASQPVSITWSPMPESGQGTNAATYRWSHAGHPTIFASVENCGRFAANLKEVAVYSASDADLSLRADAPSVVAQGTPVTYTLTLSNCGQMTATNVLVVAQVPAGASHQSGGTLNGNEVWWTLPVLGGYGTSHAFTMTVAPSAGVTETLLSTYRVQADGGINVAGAPPASSALADSVLQVLPLQHAQLVYPSSAPYSLTLDLPAGSVADPALLAATEMATLPGPLPPDTMASGRAFKLEMHQSNQPQHPFTLTEAITLSMTYALDLAPEAAHTASSAGSSPRLYHWTGSAWDGADTSCAAQTGAGALVCTLHRARSGVYALFLPARAEPVKVLLPMIFGFSSR